MDSFDTKFNVLSVVVIVVFVAVFGFFAFIFVRGIFQWLRNNMSPEETIAAKVVVKRSEVRGGGHNFPANTSYYVTFENLDRCRIELHVSGRDYGLIAEGDIGEVSFKGTRFLGFRRMSK